LRTEVACYCPPRGALIPRAFRASAANSTQCATRLQLLAPVYGWFTEGFDTLDLKEAKKLLDELQHAPATGLGIASSQT
jgi:hypothetical protein